MNKKVSREFKDGEIVKNKASAVKKLNDDALLLIFNCLCISDKIRIERVCKKWQNLARRSWSSTTYLDFSNETWTKTKKGCMILNKDIVTKVGMLCGKFLTSVSLNMPAFLEICKFNSRIQELHLYDIKEHVCSNPSKCIDKKVLEHVHINDTLLNDWQAILERIMPNINHNIVKFYMELNNRNRFTAESYKEEDLENLLASMHKVKTVSLQFSFMYKFKGTYLNQLSFNTIEEITLSDLHISNQLLSSTIQKCKNLRKIVLGSVQGLELHLVFIAISAHAKTLKHLFILRCFSDPKDLTYRPEILLNMSKLIHLEYLHIGNPGKEIACDEFIRIVSKHCPELTRLEVICPSTRGELLTDEGMSAISSLKKLCQLDFFAHSYLTRLPLEQFKFLEILMLQYCSNFKDESLCSFLENAYYLRVLNVQKCYSISDKVVRAAVDLVQRRTSNIELLVYDCPTGVFARYTHKLPTLINVSFENMYDRHSSFGTPDALEKRLQVRYYPNSVSQFHIGH